MNEIIGYVLLGGPLLYGIFLYIRARRRDPGFRIWEAVLNGLAEYAAEETNDEQG